MKNAEKKLLGMLLIKAFIATCVYLYYDSMLEVGTTFKSIVLATRDPSGQHSQHTESSDRELANEKWTTVCTNVQPPCLNMTSQTWIPVVEDKSSYIYSAYFTMSSAGPNVVIVGAQNDRNIYICQVWHWNNKSKRIEVKEEVPIEAIVLPEGHGQRYTVRLYKCVLSSEQVPLYVSMVTTSCDTPTNLMTVERNSIAAEEVRKFTICLPPLNLMYARAYEIVEWIELNRILGAEKIIVYNNSISDNVAKVLEFYSKRGITEVANWQLPMGTDIHYFGQVAALNDCLYRNKQKSEFIVNLDLDEFIIPHSEQTNNWSDMLESLDSNAEAYLFRNTFFRRDWEGGVHDSINKTLVDKYKLVTLQKLEHEHFFYVSRMRSKYIARTATVSQIMIHEVRWHQVQSVPINISFLHHYRSFGDGQAKRYKKVVDTVIPDKFGAQLMRNVQTVWTHLGDVPMDMNVLK